MNIIVTGYGRCGTSMVMKCLEAGGVPIYYTNKLHRELDVRLMKRFAQKPWEHADYAVKVARHNIYKLAAYEYRVIFMSRDPEEMEESAIKKWGGRPTEEPIKEVQEQLFEYCAQRSDFDVVTMDYNDVLESPMMHMMQLVKFVPGGFDAPKAADIVDSSLRTVKLEGEV